MSARYRTVERRRSRGILRMLSATRGIRRAHRLPYIMQDFADTKAAIQSQVMSSTAQLLLQLIVILATARVCGWVLRFVGQPAVIGEMIAGLLLGPVVFGALFPQLHAELFPKASLEGLSSLSTLGLVMFMFVVGLETKTQQGLRAQLKAAGFVGALSVITPLLLGIAISPML